jgi:hypothetical protein
MEDEKQRRISGGSIAVPPYPTHLKTGRLISGSEPLRIGNLNEKQISLNLFKEEFNDIRRLWRSQPGPYRKGDRI